MKRLWLVSTLALCVFLLAGCMNKSPENVEAEIIDEENVAIEEPENIEEEIIEEVVDDEIIDWEKWNLMAFNWKEVDWNYSMVITNDGNLTTKFCNSIGWNVSFDGDDEWTISASLIQTEMACEWESMDLENAFQINWSEYSIMADEDWWSTMIIKTDDWDKFIWRKILE